MGWRERFGGDDERAQIAARARALLDTAGPRPSPGDSSSWAAGVDRDTPAPPLPSPPPASRGGWVPSDLAAPAAFEAPVVPGGRHAVAAGDLGFARSLLPMELDDASGPVGPVDPAAGHPSWRERVRFDPGRRGLVAVAAVVVVVGSVAGGVMFRGGQSAAVTVAAASGAAPSDAPTAQVAADPSGGGASTPATPTAGSGAPSGTVTVDVAGLVVHPGVYTLPAGSRVEDALREAGGAQPGADLSTLNRARVLADGEQLAVGIPGAAAPAVTTGTGATGGPAAAGGLVDLNTAGAEQLDTLPGVGPVLAQAIVDWRTDHGRFSSIDQLQDVSGIGPATFGDLQGLVTV